MFFVCRSLNYREIPYLVYVSFMYSLNAAISKFVVEELVFMEISLSYVHAKTVFYIGKFRNQRLVAINFSRKESIVAITCLLADSLSAIYGKKLALFLADNKVL